MEEFKRDTLKIVNNVEERLELTSKVFEEPTAKPETKNELGAEPHPTAQLKKADVFERLYNASRKSTKKERK